MSNDTQVINDQRSVNEPSKVFDSMESVDRRAIINTDIRRQFDQAKFPEPRFRAPDPNQQYQIWKQPVGRPPPGYPPPRFIPSRNANEPRTFPPRNPTPLRTQEYQNRRSFEKPERPFDVDINPDIQSRPISPWQRIRERLPHARMALQSANEQQNIESLKIPFEERTPREPIKDRVPSVFRQDSITNIDPRNKPPMERRLEDRDAYAQNERKPSIPPAEYIRREPNPESRMQFDQTMRRPSLTQIQLNEQNYIIDRVQSPSVKPRPLHAVPEYENRNHYPTREEDHNRNYRPDGYRDFRKLGDLENVNRENRKFIATRPEEQHQQRVQEIGRFNGYDPVRGRMEMNLNKIDLNGTSDNRNSARSTTNENKPIQDKKPTANGDIKPPSSLPAELKKEKSALKTPTKKISPKSPETRSTNSLGDKKKVPMNKVQVGSAPSPNLKVVRSKIGSLENYTHKPGGGKVKIENRKLEWKAQPRIEAKNDKYVSSGGDKKIPQVKLQWSAKSKIGSLENATHKPGGGDKKIESVKLDFKDKAKPKVGSKDNIKHVPGGGTVKKSTDADAKSISSDIEEQKVDIKAQSKIGSLENVKHRPGGGDKKIFDDKEYLKQTNESSKANSVTTSGSQAYEDSQQCSREVYKNEKPPKQTTLAEIDSPKKSDKAKVEKSLAKEKKSEPTTPKKSLAKKQPTENKPTMSVDSMKNNPKLAQIEKTSLKEKIEPKAKIENEKSSVKGITVQPKIENVKIPSTKNSTDEINLRNKSTPNVAVQKPAFGADSKLITNTSPKNISELKNLTESEKNKPKSENAEKFSSNNQSKPKPSSVIVSKESIENKSNLSNTDKQELKPIVENKSNISYSDGKHDSKPKIENKSNFSNADKHKQELKPIVENKPNISYSDGKQDSKSKIENKSNFSMADKQELKLIAENKPNISYSNDKQDSKPKIENKSNLSNADKQELKPIVENKSNISMTDKQDSNPKIESKSNLSNANKQDSTPKIENKSNFGHGDKQDFKPKEENISNLSNVDTQDLKFKEKNKSNTLSNDKEQKKESNTQQSDKPTNITENKSNLLSSDTKDQPKSSNNQDHKPPVKNTVVLTNTVEKKLLDQSTKSMDEPQSNFSFLDKEKNKASNIPDLSKLNTENTSTIPIKTAIGAINLGSTDDSKIKPIPQPSQDMKSNFEVKKSESPQISDIATRSKPAIETKFEKNETLSSTDSKTDQDKKPEQNTNTPTLNQQSKISTQEKISNITTKEKEAPSSFSSNPKTIITDTKFSEFTPKEVKPQNPSSELFQKQEAPVASIPEQKK